MKFCQKCGAILLPKKEGKKRLLVCSCGYKEEEKEEIKVRETVEKEREIEVVKEEPEILPLTEAICPKCGNKEAYYWEVQTRSADEPATKFLKCKKCKHIWREYG